MIRRLYGAGPGHLVLVTASLVGTVYAGIRLWPLGARHLAEWFGGSVVGHDLVLFPAYAVVDAVTVRGLRRNPHLVNYVRVPVALSLLLLAVWWPLILGRDPGRLRQTGLGTGGFLARWLIITGVLVLASLVTALVSHLRRRRSAPPMVRCGRMEG